jgi:hypothetical protein
MRSSAAVVGSVVILSKTFAERGGTSPPKSNLVLARREFRKNPVIDNDIKEAVDRIATGLYSPSQNWEIFHW